MLKNLIRYWCQKLIGFERYLFFFSVLTIFRIRFLGYEKEFRHFTTLIPDEGAILDIGANIGMMTVILAQKFPASFVYAFEPMPVNAAALKRVLQFYRITNVKIFETALGNSDISVKMIMPFSGRSKMQGLSHVMEPANDEMHGEVYTVPSVQMDHVNDLQQLEKISAIKMDVENFEYYVLKGGQQLLQKHRPLIFCELWNNDRRKHCLELLEEMDYRIKVFEKGKLVDFTGQSALNFFFLP